MKSTNQLALVAAISTATMAFITFVVAVLTPPLSGPYCKAASCYVYPYLDIGSRFPRDYFWMYPALILIITYLVLMVCIHRFASEEKKTFSLVGLVFASIATAIFLIDYFLQLSVVQPSLLKGESDGISIFSQFNPHGIFIALEELGYLVMGIAFAFMAPVFHGSRQEKHIKRIFFGAATLIFISFLAYIFAYGLQREYRFEVMSISITWFTLIASGTLLARIFKNKKQ